VLGYLMPAYFRTVIYHALLDSAAAEHAARRRRHAVCHGQREGRPGQARKDVQPRASGCAITTELNEIIGGASALEDY